MNMRCLKSKLLFAVLGLLMLMAVPVAVFAQAAPTVVFSENFENGITSTTVAGFTPSNVGTGGGTSASTYNITGVTPTYTSAPFPLGGGTTTYTAATDWLDGAHCDGVILSQASTQPGWIPPGSNGCNTGSGVQSFNGVRNVALGISAYELNGGVAATYASTAAMPAGSTNNHVVAAFTECPGSCTTIGSGTAAGSNNGLMLQNTTPITTAGGSRFYTASVIVGATSCSSAPPTYQFSIGTGGTMTSVGSVNPCAAANSVIINVPNQQTSPFTATSAAISVAQVIAPNPIKLSGAAGLTVAMYSLSGATFGNDAAFDNIQVLDVTPSLSKSFASPVIVGSSGGTTTLTFTVTNTTDNLAKPGWSFTDTFPAGMTLANTTVGGTCTNATNTAGTTATLTSGTTGSSAITLGGSLPAQASCTVTVTVAVASTATGQLQNCGANISSASYIVPPTTCANLDVARAITLTKVWANATTGDAVSLTIAGSKVSSATAGSSTAPSTTTNAGANAIVGSTVTLTEAFTTGTSSNYGTALTCTKTSDGAAVTVTPSGLTGSIVMPTDSAVNCSFKNSRPRIRLQKVLPNGRVLDTALTRDQFTLTIAGPRNGSNTTATVTTTGTGNTATGTADFNPGDIGGTYTLSETAGNATTLMGLYNTSISCSNATAGSSTVLPSGSGTSFSLGPVAASDDITCTFSNPKQPSTTVTIRKTSLGSTGTFNFSGTNGVANQAITTAAVGTPQAGTTQTLTAGLTATTVTEAAPPAGFILQSIACTGMGAGGTATPTINGASGGSVLLDATATAPGSNIVCTFTNTNQADLSITKTDNVTSVVSGTTTTYTLAVKNGGPVSVTGAIVKDVPVTGLTCPTGNAVTCSGTGCPAGSLTMADLLSGITMGTMPANTTATFTVTCNVN